MEPYIIAPLILLAIMLSRSFQHGGEAFRLRKQGHLIAQKLSKDARPITFRGGYIIYAHNTEWYFEVSVGAFYSHFKLVWIYADPLDREPYDDKWRNKVIEEHSPEFQADWISTRLGVRCVKYIIGNHPNLS